MIICSAQGNGQSTAVAVPKNKSRYNDAGFTLYVNGTWDSATAVLQTSPDGGTTWISIPNASFTADSVVNIVGHHTHFRCSVSGGLGSESINMRLK